jgi:predicted nucleic acid-binding protein
MLADSNIIIYASKPGYEFLHPLVAQADLAVSVISYVETLGYHQLTEPERRFLKEFFENVNLLPLSDSVLERAISLRQTRKMKLGDSLIAATALVAGLTLVTRNAQDFDGIPGLDLLDPFAPPPSKTDC